MYSYVEERQSLSTDEGQQKFIAARDATLALIAQTGAVRAQEAMTHFPPMPDSQMMAIFDLMKEQGYIREVGGINPIGQYRVFVKA